MQDPKRKKLKHVESVESTDTDAVGEGGITGNFVDGFDDPDHPDLQDVSEPKTPPTSPLRGPDPMLAVSPPPPNANPTEMKRPAPVPLGPPDPFELPVRESPIDRWKQLTRSYPSFCFMTQESGLVNRAPPPPPPPPPPPQRSPPPLVTAQRAPEISLATEIIMSVHRDQEALERIIREIQPDLYMTPMEIVLEYFWRYHSMRYVILPVPCPTILTCWQLVTTGSHLGVTTFNYLFYYDFTNRTFYINHLKLDRIPGTQYGRPRMLWTVRSI